MNITEEWKVDEKNKVKAIWNKDKTKLISVEVMPEEKPDFAVSANVIFKLGVQGDYLEFSKTGKHNIEFVFDGTTNKLKATRPYKND